MAVTGRGAAAAALALCALCVLAAGAAAGAAQGPAMAGNRVVQPGLNYVFSRYRLQGNLNLEDCSGICQVDVGCIGWSYNRILRSCTFGYEFSPLSLVPSIAPNVVSGQPAQVFSAAQIDCTSQVDPGVDYTSWNERSIQTQTVGECAQLCAAFSASRCVAFTWLRIFRSCVLKFTLTGGYLPNRDAISGVAGPCTAGQPATQVGAPPLNAPRAQGGGPLGGGGGGGGGLLGGEDAGDAGEAGEADAGALGGGGGGGGEDGDLLGLGGGRAPAPITTGVRPASRAAPQQAAAPHQAAAPGAIAAAPPAPAPRPAPVVEPTAPQPAGKPAAAGGRNTLPKPGTQCAKLSIDSALDNAVSDVNAFAKEMGQKVVIGFASDLLKKKEAVRASLKKALKNVSPGDKKALQAAVEGAVRANVASYDGGAVELEGRRVTFPGLVWESISGDPYVEACF